MFVSINIVNQYYTKVANLYLGIFFEFLTLFDSIFDGILIAVSNKSSLTYVNENNVTLTSFTALKVYIYKKQLGFQRQFFFSFSFLPYILLTSAVFFHSTCVCFQTKNLIFIIYENNLL